VINPTDPAVVLRESEGQIQVGFAQGDIDTFIAKMEKPICSFDPVGEFIYVDDEAEPKMSITRGIHLAGE
jgi:hypothetical protein